MSLHRYAALRDKNEPEIISACVWSGWTVIQVSAPGFPDLLLVRRGVVRFFEVKSGKGVLTPAQKKLHLKLLASGVRVDVVRNKEEALAALKGVSHE